MKKEYILIYFVLSMAFISCSNTKTSESMPNQKVEPNFQNDRISDSVYISINAGDDMLFDRSKLSVHEDQVIVLMLHHTGKMTKKEMGHNWLLLAQGTSKATYAMEAMKAAKTNYIPDQLRSSVIAHTSLIGGGESDTIIFSAPSKGTYEYICSFPGHFGMMNGELFVK